MRGGHCSFIKKTLGEVKGLLSNPELERETLYNRKSSLEEQLGVIQTLDNDILKVLEDTDETEEAVIANEIEEAGVSRADIKAAIRLLEESLPQKNSESEANRSGERLYFWVCFNVSKLQECKGTTAAKIWVKQRHTKDAYKGITEASTSLQRPRPFEIASIEEHWTPKPPRAENGNAKGDLRSASALIAKSEEERCAYSLGRHAHESCDKVVRAAGLPVKSKEWLEISVFSKAMNDYKLRDVFDLEIASCKGEKRLL
ncbi:Hypothetical predicted protein [Paramuricea clavata]|uniref:Uncharacterized protein n=1 Tax=Paramuricea clavata TaxID=317549 RepID=A0A7D9EVU0_PARCT|nr:Hypothetical predicted protein [Paramuricea clavata]